MPAPRGTSTCRPGSKLSPPRISGVRTPWGDEVVAGHYAGHPGLVYRQRPRSFAELLFGVDRWAERTFLVQGDRRITFGEFFTAIDAARDMMVPLGIQPGDRVLLLAYNSADWVVALWAIWSLGAVPVLGNRWWSGSEAAHSIAAVTPRAAITDAVDLLATADLPILDITVLDGCGGGADGPHHARRVPQQRHGRGIRPAAVSRRRCV